ncbi:MAG: 7TM-DISM domain-containing protein, partial [Spirochaetales bacterium]|nr:7TM-DISM domain-containing protein [Spirochaetales bacterium]
MKIVSKLKSPLFSAGLLLILCGCAPPYSEPDSRKDSFYINLYAYPLYVKNGFVPPESIRIPELSSDPWQVIQSKPDLRRSVSIKYTGLPDLPKRVFLSPFREKDREYTMVIPFTVSPEQFEQFNEKKSPQPGIFLATLGDNWEIFLNGYRVKSEVHLDEEGQILSGRNWRYISLPLDRSMFVRGTNILALRIIGAPNYDGTGLCYDDPYYIDEYEIIQKNHNEFLMMAFCGVYIFVGIYHLLLFLSRPRDRFNLYYCFFSAFLGIYSLMRSHSIYSLIPDTNITYQIEYAAIFMALPLLSAFLEHLSFGKTTIVTRVYGAFCLLLALAQWIFPRPFGDDILRVWWVSDLFGFAYIIGYGIIYAFYRAVAEQKRAAGKPPRKALGDALIKTPQGNLILGVIIMSAAGVIDILSSFFMNRGVFSVSNYGFFLFTITITLVLARRFGSLFHRLDTMNTALERSNVNL